MRFISSRLHGALDYIVGILLILVPWLLGFARGGAETWVPVLLGIGAILYSMFTDYEFGAYPRIPFPVHLGLDAASGLLLAASPWLFGFAHHVWVPHVVFGGFEILAALLTNPAPALGRSRSRHLRT